MKVGDEGVVKFCKGVTLVLEGEDTRGYDPMYFKLVLPKVEVVEYNESEWE